MQSKRDGGRPKEEVEMSKKFMELQKLVAIQEKEIVAEKNALEAKQRTMNTVEQDKSLVLQLRKSLNLNEDLQKLNAEENAKLQKELDDLLVQIEELNREKPPVVKELEVVKKEIEKRKIKPDDKPPPVIVQPSGSGSNANKELYFIEAIGSGIVIHKSDKEKIRLNSGSIGVDDQFNEWLKSIKGKNNAMILFLLREDGVSAYNRAAGWAENEYGIATGKLPLPGKGEVDLSMFQTKP